MGHLSDFGTASLTHSETRGLYEMWQALRGDRPAPFRAELDASKIGARAPFLAILEYVGPSNFRIRIAGDRLNAWFGIELRGMSALSMIQPEARNHFQSALNRLAGEPAVAAVRGRAQRPDGFSAAFEMTLLPMRSDFGRIDRVLVGLWLIDAPARTQGPLRLDPTEFVVTSIRDDAVGGFAATEHLGAEADAPEELAAAADAPEDRAAAADAPEDRAVETDAPDGDALREEPATCVAEQPAAAAPDSGPRRGHLRVITGGRSRTEH